LLRAGAQRALALAVLVLAAAVGIAALGSAFGLPALPEPLAELDLRLPGIFKIHMMASSLGLILLPWILVLRHRSSLHRRLGRLGAGLLFVGAVTSLPSALSSEAVLVARLGFFAQGVLCLAFLVGGVRAIWRRDFQRHVQLMMRMSALVFGAVVLRALMAVAMTLGCPFNPTYAALAWLSWALPLAMVTLWPQVRHSSGPRASRLLKLMKMSGRDARGPREEHERLVGGDYSALSGALPHTVRKRARMVSSSARNTAGLAR
jgi:hypothetical protein